MPRRPLDITHILAPAPAGGLERVVEMLATGQRARGHEVSVIAILPGPIPEPAVVDRVRRAGVAVTVLRVAGRAYLAERRSFASVLAGRPRGVLHSHGYRADVLYSPFAAKLGFATVSTFHGFTGGDWKNRIYEHLDCRAARRIGRVVGVSKPIVDRLLASGVDAARLRFVANAYSKDDAILPRSEARARLGLDETRFVIGWVGRLSPEKAPDVLISAMALLADLPVTGVVIGDGPLRDSIRNQAAAVGVAHLVHWAGAITGVGELFGAFDTFVISSRTEGTPIVLFEAMAAGVPIVTTAVGGIPDVVTPGEAVLVPSEDPEALAGAIRSVFADRVAAARRAAGAAGVLEERFSPRPWLDSYDTIYGEAVGAARSRTAHRASTR